MRSRYTSREVFYVWRLILLLVIVSLSACAQDPQHVSDGHVVERLQSVTIPTKAGAPFRATVVTDWTRMLADGTRVTLKNHRAVARDSTGRVFQERRYFAPDGDTRTTQLTELDYYDPVRKEVSVCVPMRKLCTVHELQMDDSLVDVCKPIKLPHMTVTCDALGTGQTDNVQTLGSREIMTVLGGPQGYKEPEPTIKEFWFSPRLELNLIVKRFEPRGGAQDFVFQNVDLSEPDPKLFSPPQDFRTARTVIQ